MADIIRTFELGGRPQGESEAVPRGDERDEKQHRSTSSPAGAHGANIEDSQS